MFKKVEFKEKNQGIEEEINIAKLSLIDLAGSEKSAGLKGNSSIRLFELY